ncbi:MAG: hypothetical protein ACLVIS_02535 [Dorea longicatena]|jgi:hypothetical protein
MELYVSDEECYIKTRKEFDISSFIERIKANSGMKKNSFADKYVIKIFSDLLIGAVDLGKRYRKYYSIEYDTLHQYLYRKEMLDENLIDNFELSENETVWKLRYKNNTILGYENENLEVINQALRLFENEN